MTLLCYGYLLVIFNISNLISAIKITGLMLLNDGEYKIHNKSLLIQNGVENSLKFTGINISDADGISFTALLFPSGQICDESSITTLLAFNPNSQTSTSALTVFKMHVYRPDKLLDQKFYICSHSIATKRWYHNGEDISVIFEDKKSLLPLWLNIILVISLICLSGLFSGLNLGLMSLTCHDLEMIIRTGSTKEKYMASKILPIRKRGNFLLCTILLGNALTNSTLTIFLDSLIPGGIAIIPSTLTIVILGEILPQSVCSKHALVVGSYTRFITMFFMLVTLPLSFPISLLLDKIVGPDLPSVFSRVQLLEMVKMNSGNGNLEQDEVGIISGALKYKSKTVIDVMTPIFQSYLIDEDTILDFATMSDIFQSGFSRIPVYSGNRSNIVALLYTKDLMFVDPDDKLPLLNIVKFYNRSFYKFFHDMTLDKVLNEFKKGVSHIGIVIKIDDTGPGDPFYETIGLVSLEDIIEEIIQTEIVDETDVIGHEQLKIDRNKPVVPMIFFQHDNLPSRISPSLALATSQYLRNLTPFSHDLISDTVLKKLVTLDSCVKTSSGNKEPLYSLNKTADYFIIILEGYVELQIGSEHFNIEQGPFSYFGISLLENLSDKNLSKNNFSPDFNLLVKERCCYLKVSLNVYKSAVKASKIERINQSPIDKSNDRSQIHLNSNTYLDDSISLGEFVVIKNEINPTVDVIINHSQQLYSESSPFICKT